MSKLRLPKRVRITAPFDDRQVGEEYDVECVVLAAGLTFYGIERYGSNSAHDLLYGDKCEVIEYHEPS